MPVPPPRDQGQQWFQITYGNSLGVLTGYDAGSNPLYRTVTIDGDPPRWQVDQNDFVPCAPGDAIVLYINAVEVSVGLGYFDGLGAATLYISPASTADGPL